MVTVNFHLTWQIKYKVLSACLRMYLSDFIYQPVYIGLKEFHAVDHAAVWSKFVLLHDLVQAYQLLNVNCTLQTQYKPKFYHTLYSILSFAGSRFTKACFLSICSINYCSALQKVVFPVPGAPIIITPQRDACSSAISSSLTLFVSINLILNYLFIKSPL